MDTAQGRGAPDDAAELSGDAPRGSAWGKWLDPDGGGRSLPRRDERDR